MEFELHALPSEEQERVARFIEERWGSRIIVAHGAVYEPHRLPGFAAWLGDELVGLVTYHVDGGACEIVTIDSLRPKVGVGGALLRAVARAARQAGCRRLWLITTNDNLNALRFYQKRGFRLAAVHRGAVTSARRIKPQIPLIGFDGIPIEDEWKLELGLEPAELTW